LLKHIVTLIQLILIIFNGTPDDVEGYSQLPSGGNTLILTKSLKDIICFHNIGISAISLQGENNTFKPELYKELKERFKRIIVFYDNDETGKQAALKITNQYNDIKSISIPEEYGTKDYSDTIKAKGINTARTLVDSLLT